MKKPMILLMLLLLATLPLFCEDISFSGGYTRMNMQQGNEIITLGNKAQVTVGSLTLMADSIELSGDNFSYVNCTGSVSVTDPQRGFSLVSKNLYYDRIKKTMIVNSWVEIQDTTNEIIASGAWLEFDLDKGTILLQIHVKLFHATEEGPMVCKADTLTFDRNEQTLKLMGNANVDWNSDTYQAQVIRVDLDTQEIKMDGSIKGTVHG
jgi:lipopolysaccharide export system protein LptA